MHTKLIAPSSRPDIAILEKNLAAFDPQLLQSFQKRHKPIMTKTYLGDELNPAYFRKRADALAEDLLGPQRAFLWALRGGYGSQGLLPLLPFDDLEHSAEKILVGFSDLCALQMGLWRTLGWRSIHAPMAATPYWQPHDRDTSILGRVLHGSDEPIEIAVTPLNAAAKNTQLQSTLLGGSFSCITSLIGTNWCPNFSDSILFLEDIAEPPGRLLRWLDQWQQAGMLDAVQAIILGRFIDCNDDQRGLDETSFKTIVARKLSQPVFSCTDIGHCQNNTPVGIGVKGTITSEFLRWSAKELRND